MRSKRYVCLIFCIALFALIAISSRASSIIYDYASKENFEGALFDNLTTTSNIGVRKGNDGGYWFFEPNTSSANGPSCCEGDLLKRVYAQLDQYVSVIISKETDGDKTSYRIFPEDPSIVGGLLPYTYGWGTPYTPGYPYQWGGFPGVLGTSPAFSVGYSYPWGVSPGGWWTSPTFGAIYPSSWGNTHITPPSMDWGCPILADWATGVL